MPSKRLTVSLIDKWPSPDAPVDIRDTIQRGLSIRMYPSGHKVWRMRYRWRGQRPIMTLGAYPEVSLSDARAMVIEAHAQIREGYDPGADKQRIRAEQAQMPTVAEFVDEYIERHARPNKKTWEKDRDTLDRNVVPHIGKLRLDEVHRRDIVHVLDIIRDRGAETMAARTYAYVRKMFNFAVERGVLDMSPAQHIRTAPARQRDIVLDDKAIKHLWAATSLIVGTGRDRPMHPSTRNGLRLLLLTGQRSGEVARAGLREFDLDKRTWLVPKKHTKNGLANTVPLSDLAMTVIEDMLEAAAMYRGASGAKTPYSISNSLMK